MIAALVASSEDYNLIINMAVVGMFMCLLAAFMPARLLDQQANTNSVSE
jgi:hypothetical protein